MAYQTEKASTRARALRKNDTEAERRLWEELRGSRLNGYKFVRQLPIGPYFADFACRSAKLIVEVDGVTHGDAHEVAYDAKRSLFLNEQGWAVHRVWNDNVFKERNAVCDGILLALSAR
jgi:very-short-patch-repair endonuclease